MAEFSHFSEQIKLGIVPSSCLVKYYITQPAYLPMLHMLVDFTYTNEIGIASLNLPICMDWLPLELTNLGQWSLSGRLVGPIFHVTKILCHNIMYLYSINFQLMYDSLYKSITLHLSHPDISFFLLK